MEMLRSRVAAVTCIPTCVDEDAWRASCSAAWESSSARVTRFTLALEASQAFTATTRRARKIPAKLVGETMAARLEGSIPATASVHTHLTPPQLLVVLVGGVGVVVVVDVVDGVVQRGQASAGRAGAGASRQLKTCQAGSEIVRPLVSLHSMVVGMPPSVVAVTRRSANREQESQRRRLKLSRARALGARN